jgi:hypothetical protein
MNDTSDLPVVERILERDFLDDRAQQESQAALGVMQEALERTFEDPSMWDPRLTKRTRRRMIVKRMDEHITRWARERGMDLDEVARLRREGGRP